MLPLGKKSTQSAQSVDDSSILNMKLLNWLRDLGRPTPSAQDDSELDPDDPFPEPVEVEITDVFDLHTIQPREVKLVVEEYLHQAHELGFRSVRIIHGKGIGVQREMVRSIVAKTPFVVSWTDAPAEAGGWGATIVRLQTDD